MKGIKVFIILLILISFLFILENAKDKQLIDNISKVTSKGILDIKATLFFLGVAVNIDPDVPKIYIDSPLNQTYTTTSIDLKYTVVDNSLDTTYYNIDDGENISITGNISFTTTLGSHILKLFANDTLGRLNSSSVTFAVIQSAGGGGTGGAGGGGGGGGGRGQAIKDYDFRISQEIIKISLDQGETKIETVEIENTGNKAINLKIDLKQIKDLLIFAGGLSKYELNLEPGEKQNLQLIFNAPKDYKPGIYTGKIIFSSLYEDKTLTAIIEVESIKKIFDVDIRVQDKEVFRGENLIAEIILFNLGNDVGKVDTDVEVGIKDLDGNIIAKKQNKIAVETQASFTESILIPMYLNEGMYIVYALVEFDGEIGTATELFNVIESPRGFFSKSTTYILLGIAFAIILFLIIYEKIRHPKRKNKKISDYELNKLLSNIKKTRASRYNSNEIKNYLIKKGLSRKQIKEIFRSLR